nr:MAG TPA: hypothetical protein [Caudoviricetes sp.]
MNPGDLPMCYRREPNKMLWLIMRGQPNDRRNPW